MSATVSFFPAVNLLRKQARRAHTAAGWTAVYQDTISERDMCEPGGRTWHHYDQAARAFGARASAWMHLRDGNAAAARVCLALSHRYRRAVDALS